MTWNGEAERRSPTLTVSWWQLILLICTVFGFFFLAILNHESRISRTEEMCKNILKIEKLVQEIRNDQIRRYEKEIDVQRQRHP